MHLHFSLRAARLDLFLIAGLVTALTAPAAWAEVPKVATDTPVVQSLTAMVMDTLGEPVVLMDAGADAHDYQLRPSQAAALERAGLLVWIGPQMTPWLERPAAARAPEGVLTLLELPATHRLAHDGAGHDHEGTDPHAWLDPSNAAIWVQAIADALASHDPQNAGTYQANARRAQDRIMALDADIASRLASAAKKPLVLGHDAYGYLAERYGLAIAGTIATGDAANPGAARLAALRDTITQAGVACILPDVGQSAATAEMLSAGTSVRVGAALDPEGRTLPAGPELYLGLMSGLADAITGCLARP